MKITCYFSITISSQPICSSSVTEQDTNSVTEQDTKSVTEQDTKSCGKNRGQFRKATGI